MPGCTCISRKLVDGLYRRLSDLGNKVPIQELNLLGPLKRRFLAFFDH